MGRFFSIFKGKEIDARLKKAENDWAAAYFDPATFTQYGFRSEEDKARWLATGDDSLIAGEGCVFSFSTIQQRVRVVNGMSSTTLYYTTKAESAEIICSFVSEEKSITESNYEEINEDFLVSVEVDRGFTGTFEKVVTDQLVLNGQSFSTDIRKVIATGTNRVKITAKGVMSGAQGHLTYTINLTSMYLSPSNFTWYTPFIEGATYNLGGMMIGGNLQKVLKIKVTKEGYEKMYEVNIGSATYITNAYTFTGLEFPTAGTGIYNVELWLDANGLESEHLRYNIICISQADQYTARLISVSEQPDKVFNFAENSLFKYAIYNAGAATGTPHVKVSSIVKATPTVLVDEDLVDVPTGAPLDYTVAIEIETEETDVQLDAVITFGNEQQTIYAVDNSKSFPATSGAVFYINPAIRSNAQENKDKIVNAIDSKVYDAVFERMAWTDGTDGWTTDNAGRKCLRLPASSTCTIPYQPFAKMSGSKTIELTYKVENAADYTEPIITICDDPTSADFRGIKITPKEIAIHSRDLKDTELQNYKPTDEETLNVIISIVPNYKTNYGNLVKVWCNGSPVREFSFESNDSWLQSGNIILGSQTADFYLYKMRVYESAFGAPNAMQNFVNSLPTAEDKQAAQAQIDNAINDSYQLDYDACVKAGLNTFEIEMLDGAELPSITHPSGGKCNLLISIKNLIDGELDDYMRSLLSGKAILNQPAAGQGTTAMTYAVWNLIWKLLAEYNKRRITAKKNFASSMQSHKMGATRLFNILNKKVVGPNEAGANVAVSQYPAYGYAKVKVEGTTDQYNRVPIGLYTIGPDKGDKHTFGYDDPRFKDTLIHMEGADHTPMAVGMDYPWEATRYDASKGAMGAIGNTGDVVAAWEVGAAGSFDPESSADQANVQAMLDAEFEPAYNVAYHNSPYILGVSETLDQINADVAAWRRNTTDDGKSYSQLEFYTIGTYELYYYNIQRQRYEATGVNVLNDIGLTASDVSSMTAYSINEMIKDARRARFKANWGGYWHTDDSIFQYTFNMMFGATDNYKKNTYPYKFKLLADGGRWRWRADDLDTLFDINNQGLAAKAYSVLVGDQTTTGSGSIYRGDTSVFWTLIRETCQAEIKAMVHRIFDAMVELAPEGNNTLDKIVACIKKYFWNLAQNYFSAAAYNADAEYTYEDSWAAGLWKEVNPLSQSLGGHYEAERDWVKMRVLFLASYYNYGPFGAVNDSFSDTSTGQLVYGGAGQHTFEITPAIDFNPTILRGQSELVTVGDRVKAGETVDLTVPDSSGADTRIYVQGADWFKSIGDLSQLQVSADNPSLSVASKRLQSLKVGDEVASNVTSNLKTLNMGANPSMMVVDARNLTSLTGTVDLSGLPRLRQALFGGTNVRSLGVASGSKVEHLQFGNGTTALTLLNLKFLESLELGDTSKIEFFCVENCDGFNAFEMLKETYNLDSQALKDIRIIGFVYDGDSADADMLANLANDLDKNGNEHPYNAIDGSGQPQPDTHPIIEGTLNVEGSIYEDSAEAIRANYPNLVLNVKGGLYIRFEDQAVADIVIAKWGDGTGITKEQAAEATTDVFGYLFRNNTSVIKFNEARYFKQPINLYEFADGATNFSEITFADGVSITSGYYAFRNTALTKLVANNIVASGSWEGFCTNSALEELDMSSWGISAITTLLNMCSGAQLKRIMLPDGATLNVPSNMFKNCPIESISGSKLKLVGKCDGMFYGAGNGGILDLSSWDVSEAGDMRAWANGIFMNSNFDEINISGWSFYKDQISTTNYNSGSAFNSCKAKRIIMTGVTAALEGLGALFAYCTELEEIVGFSDIDFSTVIAIPSLILHTNIKHWDFSHNNFVGLISMERAFSNTNNVESFNFGDYGFGKNATSWYVWLWYGSNYQLRKCYGHLDATGATGSFPTFNIATLIRRIELRGLGTHADWTAFNVRDCQYWGAPDDDGTDLDGNLQSMIDTLLTYSFDRAVAGYSACTITLHANALARLVDAIGDSGMLQIINKGYTITNYTPAG